MRTSICSVVVAGLLLAAVPTAALAAPGGGTEPNTGKPAPTNPAPKPSPDRVCTLSPSLSHHGGDFASCLSVGARISTVPALGRTATLTVTVKAARSELNTQVTIDLPKNLVFADGTPTTAAVSGAGQVARSAPATVPLAAGQTRSFTRTVKAVAAGFGEIAVSAKNRLSAARTDAGADSVYLTVGAAGQSGHLGGDAAAHGAVPGATAAAHPSGLRATTGASLPALPRPNAQRVTPNTAGTSCVTGGWFYADQNGTTRPMYNAVIKVLNSSNVVLASQYAGSDGSYNLCWSTGGSSTNVYVQFWHTNIVWKVVTLAGNDFVFATGTVTVADGTSFNFGNLEPADGTQMRGLHAYEEANDEYQWIYRYETYQGGCWSPFQTSCQQLVVHWQSDSTTGTYWNTTGVYLLAGSPDTLDEPVHEYGHALMYNLYGQSYPATTNCNPHFLFTASSTTCAFTEGWADWVATSVYNNMVWTFNGGGQTNMDVSWNEGFGYDTGDQVEARLVQAMRSLTDGVKYPFDNDAGEGAGVNDNRLFLIDLADFEPNTFSAFWSGRAALGQDTSQVALSALYQGTVDYGFYNPLANYVGKYQPEAVPDHHYSYSTTTGFWSVVAAKPDAGSDVDVYLYDAANNLLASSAFGGNVTDFVAVNSNSGHRGLQGYHPTVHQFAGAGNYTVMVAQGSQSLSAGSSTAALSTTTPVKVWDSFQSAGVPVYYRAVPGSGSQDLQLAALNAASDLVPRGSSSQGTDPGAGNAATLVYTPSTTGWQGLVLINNSLASGGATVYADTTAPAGSSVQINSGAATTTNPNVTLQLASADPDTGVSSMQISTDGVFDTEPVVAYATTAHTTLPGNNGTKTVYARFLNNAGIWSAPVQDTIRLSAVAAISAIAPGSGPVNGGNAVTITGDYLNGATAVKFGTKPATSFTIDSAHQITAVVPRGAAPGTVRMYVTTPAGTNADGAHNKYTYVARPAVTSISPTAGPTAGGTSVTINGTGFSPASTVKFGANSASSVTYVSATKLTAVSPAGASGVVDVRVTNVGGTSAPVAGDVFTYAAQPTISSVAPNHGPAGGGTLVTITGSNFTTASNVKFGTHAATSFTVLSATKIQATVPAGTSGQTVDIRVVTAGGTSPVATGDRYSYN